MEMLSERLGVSTAEFARLEESGIVSTTPVAADLRPMGIPDQTRAFESKALQRQDSDFRDRIARSFGDAI